MTLIDRSPGLFMAAAFALVYGFIGLEVVMWIVGSLALVLAVLTLEVGVAVLMVRAVLRFVTAEGATDEHAPAAAPAATPVRRAPGFGRRALVS